MNFLKTNMRELRSYAPISHPWPKMKTCSIEVICFEHSLLLRLNIEKQETKHSFEIYLTLFAIFRIQSWSIRRKLDQSHGTIGVSDFCCIGCSINLSIPRNVLERNRQGEFILKDLWIGKESLHSPLTWRDGN